MDQSKYTSKPLSARLKVGNRVAVHAPAKAPSHVPITLSVGKSEKLRDQDAQAIRDQESEGGLVAEVSAEAPPKAKTERGP